jgi:transcriptional regulator with XRE-family HTH domain
MQPEDTSAPGRGRYARGIKQPNPVKLSAVSALLAAHPSISKSELARRAGLTRATVGYYMKHLAAEVAAAAEKKAEVRERTVASHLDLLERVTRSADEVGAEVERLRSRTPDPAVARAFFAGHSTLNAIHRTLGELLGEIAPPTHNVYLTKIDALLAAPVDAASLPAHVRATLG